VLRVHFSPRTEGDVRKAEYVATLRSRHGELRGVALTESATEATYAGGAKQSQSQWSFEFQLERASGGHSSGWGFSIEYGETSWTAAPPGGPQHGEGFAKACGGRARIVPASLYEVVLHLLRRAQRHELARPPVDVTKYCEEASATAAV
jgi:hypothetical protein